MIFSVAFFLQWTSHVRALSVSGVTTTAASTAMSCATLLKTVGMAPMREWRTVSPLFHITSLILWYGAPKGAQK